MINGHFSLENYIIGHAYDEGARERRGGARTTRGRANDEGARVRRGGARTPTANFLKVLGKVKKH